MVSAGGVVYREGQGGVEVVICGRTSPHIWGLPKGTPEAGESREETALREVTEETGLDVVNDEFIDAIDYWFVRSQDGVRCHKTVYFYLMSPTGGDVSRHDHEFDVVRWTPVEEALEALTYADEVRIVQKGVALVGQNDSSG
jgi:8-oxo-dGTP pyrophosphatase MutT (NUDIX family)